MRAKNLAEWRELVLQRNNYTCQDCGAQEANLIAHHIKSQFLFPNLKLQVANGLTLCRQCHQKRLEFALRLFPSYLAKGYLPKMPSAEEARAQAELKAHLASLHPKIRYSYHSRPYKIRTLKGQYWVTLPKVWIERELRRLKIAVGDFATNYEAEWSYKFGLPYMLLKKK